MSGPLYRDPWSKREAWRKHPIFSNRAMFSNIFPGFGFAVVAFAAYVVVDNLVHPSNIEQLKKQAKESADRPSLLSLLGGSKAKGTSESQVQQ